MKYILDTAVEQKVPPTWSTGKYFASLFVKMKMDTAYVLYLTLSFSEVERAVIERGGFEHIILQRLYRQHVDGTVSEKEITVGDILSKKGERFQYWYEYDQASIKKVSNELESKLKKLKEMLDASQENPTSSKIVEL